MLEFPNVRTGPDEIIQIQGEEMPIILLRLGCLNLVHRQVTPKCLVLNARSLVKPDAASSLCTQVTTNKIDVCFISETWLNSNVHSSLICPNGYALIRRDRLDARPGGGVAILCRKIGKLANLITTTQFLSAYGAKS